MAVRGCENLERLIDHWLGWNVPEEYGLLASHITRPSPALTFHAVRTPTLPGIVLAPAIKDMDILAGALQRFDELRKLLVSLHLVLVHHLAGDTREQSAGQNSESCMKTNWIK